MLSVEAHHVSKPCLSFFRSSLKYVVYDRHNWTDDLAHTILTNVKKAMKPSARLVIRTYQILLYALPGLDPFVEEYVMQSTSEDGILEDQELLPRVCHIFPGSGLRCIDRTPGNLGSSTTTAELWRRSNYSLLHGHDRKPQSLHTQSNTEPMMPRFARCYR